MGQLHLDGSTAFELVVCAQPLTSPRLFCVRTVAFHVRRSGSSSDSNPRSSVHET